MSDVNTNVRKTKVNEPEKKEFLDKYGLSHFWEKAKSYIDSKASMSDGSNTFLVKAPIGAIVIWSGTAENIPTGWHLCNGKDGTPDLRDKFVLGAGEKHPVDKTGGVEEVALTVEQMPRHNHPISTAMGGGQNTTSANSRTVLQANPSTSPTNSNDVVLEIGESNPHPNMPPYYALCYIMKVAADETDGGMEFTTDDTLTMSEDNVLGVATPIRAVTKEELSQMSDGQKQGFIVVIDEDARCPAMLILTDAESENDNGGEL